MSTGGNIRPPRWPVVGTTSRIGDLTSLCCSTVAFVPGDISSESEACIAPSHAHARCPYCGTARRPWTYTNCVNCGAPA